MTFAAPPLAWAPCFVALALAAACASPQPQGACVGTPDRADRVAAAPSAAASATPSAAASSAPEVGPITARYREVAAKIVAHSSRHHAAFERLRFLTDRIGNRISGSPALDRAVAWAEGELAKAGLENVHREKAMVPHWVRGAESARVTAPERRSLAVLGLGGTVPTPRGGVAGEVVVITSFEALDKLGEAGVKDKIVLYDVAMPAFDEHQGSGYGDVVKYRSGGPSKAAKYGAKAVLLRSVTARSLKTPHTGQTSYEKDVPKIPAAAITIEDATWIHRLVDSGQKVTVELALESKSLPDAESANVVGELAGSEKPDEVVILGAHLDSWDVGQGAHDDGAGVVMCVQALADLKALGLRPRRTLRVVLFTNEENGLKGAFAYGDAHKAEAPAIVAAIEADLGGFAPAGFHLEAPAEKKERVLARARDLVELLAPLDATKLEEGFSGADLIPLTKLGVTGFGFETRYGTYFDYHHSEADTLDKVDPDDLAKSTAALAVMAFALADMPERIDR